MIERITTAWQNISSMKPETANAVKYLLFFLITADIFGVWWYLKMKVLGSALLIVILIGLAIIMIIESKFERRDNRYTEQKLDNDSKPEMTIKCDECGKKFRTQNELAQHIMAKHIKKKKTDLRKVIDSQKEEPEDETAFGLDNLGFPSSEEYNKRMERGLGGGIGM